MSQKRSSSVYSLNSELNESNSGLDLSIKEALNTLKGGTKKQNVVPSRITISPRPVGRVYSNPSTPRRSFRGNQDSSKVRVSLLTPSQSHKQIVRVKGKVVADLDEFLETERLVQKEVHRPALKGKDSARDPIRKTTDFGKKVPNWYREENKPVNKEKILEQTVKNLNVMVKKCKNFIERIQNSNINKKLITKLAFKVWTLTIRDFKSNLT